VERSRRARGNSKPIIDKLNAAANRALGSTEMKAKLAEDGSTRWAVRRQFADYIKAEHANGCGGA
jgi:tripartite-type tricarboxylate transporter receptor subunit TctC